VSKSVDTVTAPDAALGDRTHMVYLNTNATRGRGEFVVTATRMGTEVGHISGMRQAQDESKSPLTLALEKLTNAARHRRRARALGATIELTGNQWLICIGGG
jgi:P-type Ca2+ transporter type 2C